jgi:hypothetical protein
MTDILMKSGDGLKSVPQSENTTASMESLLGEVADEFTQRLNRGEQPDIEEYAARFPRIATLLRQVLPALQLLRGSRPRPPTCWEYRIVRKLKPRRLFLNRCASAPWPDVP